ncbi:MAG: phage portal protein [Halanaerobiales bacterium]|nr:phage portal protein [Halanaerobiales bacterium]
MVNPLKKATKSSSNKMETYSERKLKPFQIINNVLNSTAKWFNSNYRNNTEEGYKKSIYVYRVIRERAKALSSVPLVVKQKTDDGEDEELPNHPLKQLLDKPNEHYSEQTLKEFWQMSRLLSGNSYLHLSEMNPQGQPEELYYLRPDRITVKPSEQNFIESYIYKVNGRKHTLDNLEVLHFKLLDPTNDYYGMSPVEAGAQTIDTSNSIQKWNKIFFDNAARPDGAFVSDSRMDDAEYARAKKQVQDRYTGTQNAHKPLLLEGGVDWKEIGKTHKDLDFPKLKRWTVIDICVLFEVDPIFVGLPEASSYNNKREAKKSFWEDTILHDVNDLVTKLNNELASRYKDDIYIEADLSEIEALKENENDRVKRINSKVKSNYITLNEARVADGRQERPDMDITLTEHQANLSTNMQTASIRDELLKKKL